METILSRSKLRNKTTDSYADIYDGKVYQQQMSLNFLSNPNNISVIFNTDGVPVFRSSNFSFWPQYLVINELPLKTRYMYNLKCVLFGLLIL